MQCHARRFVACFRPLRNKGGLHLHVAEIEPPKLSDGMAQGRNAMVGDLCVGTSPCIERVRGRLDEIVPVVPRSLVIFLPFFGHIPIKAEKPCFNVALRNEPGTCSMSVRIRSTPSSRSLRSSCANRSSTDKVSASVTAISFVSARALLLRYSLSSFGNCSRTHCSPLPADGGRSRIACISSPIGEGSEK